MPDHARAGHDHAHGGGGGAHAGHDHARDANARQLTLALALTGTFLVAEVIGGLVFGSLALLSDAAHMFTDAAALAIALAAIKIGQRPADERRTFGYRRFEILAAAFNAVLLFGVALYVLVEGIQRILRPEPVQATGMLVIAGLGLVVNLIAMRILASGKERSLNVKGAYLEVWADMLGSLGVLAGALVIRFTGWTWVDPIAAIAIGLWVLPRTWVLLRDSTHILLEGAPRGVILADVRAAIGATPGVSGVHDLHVWVSGADQPSCSAHVELAPGADDDAVRKEVAAKLAGEFALEHVTIQTERDACERRDELHA
jgi:cobalt-zinc-cadmium efflux system protein